MAKHEIGPEKSVDSDEERETPSKRGHAARDERTAHFSSGEAREAGHKGGKTSQEERHH